MIQRALAALALGGTLLIFLPGSFQPLNAQQNVASSPELIERYRSILTSDPDNLTIHYLLGIALLRDQQNVAALAELQTAYPAYQDSIEAHYNLAIAALRLNDLDSAEIYLEEAIELGADETPEAFPIANLYFNMALKSREQGNTNEAIRYFHKVLSLAPQRYEVYRQLGDLYASRNETDLAVKSFRSYLEEFPDDSVSREYLFALEFNRAQDLLATERLVEAKSSFNKALELQPESPTALYYLGYIAYREDQLKQAAEFLRKAFATADESLRQSVRPLLYNIALALREANNPLAAMDIAGLLAEQPDAQLSELYLAGTLNLELGSHRAAYEYLQRVVKLDPSNQGAQQSLLAAELGAFTEWLTTARILLSKEELDEAESALHEADILQPHNAKVTLLKKELATARRDKSSALVALARTALDAGDLSIAYTQLEQGLAIQPDNPDGLALQKKLNAALVIDLGRLLDEAAQAIKAGNWALADSAYQRILAVSPQHPEAQAGLVQLKEARSRQATELFAAGHDALDAGRAEEAIDIFTELLTIMPDNAQAIEGLASAKEARANRLDEFLLNGRKAMGRNKYDEAKQWFEKALEVDESPTALEELANLEGLVRQRADILAEQAERAIDKGLYKEAGQLYNQALKLVPGHVSSTSGKVALAAKMETVINEYLAQGKDALLRRDNSEATEAFQKVLKIAPENREALDGLETSRKNQESILDETILLGQQALEAGKLDEAEQHLSEALKLDAYHKETQQLRQRLEQVRQSGAQPGDEQKLYLQGVAYYTQGKYADAIKAWETVILLAPDNEKARLNIEKTRRKMRQIEEYRGG